MIRATGSQIIIKMLELEGVRIVAGIPGGSILPLYDELNKSEIRHVLVRQEQAAGFIAQGMARLNGKPAVCMATSGPGAMNLLTAIADARCDSVPIVAFTGQVNSSLIGTDAFQEADTFGLSFPITKHSVMVKKPEELLTVIPDAFAIAQSGRPGPVLIDVPRDVQTAVAEFESWPTVDSLSVASIHDPAEKFRADDAQLKSEVDKMCDALLKAKRPVIYIGGGCRRTGATETVRGFVEKYRCAVVSSLMGLGVVSRLAENNFGMLGMHGSYAANLAMHDADLVFAVGVRFDDRATGLISEFCPDAKILHIDVDAAEINKILPADISLVCDVKSALPLLTEKMSSAVKVKALEDERDAWVKKLVGVYNETESVILGRNPSVPEASINPRAFIRDIPLKAGECGIKAGDLVVTTDVGQHQMWSAQYYPVENPRHFLTSGSLGTMGFGLPAAIGAALADRSKRVVCISGDGSIMMNIQELSTLAEENLDVTIFIMQNGSLGMVRQQQQYLFNKNYSASEFRLSPDFLTIAKGFRIDAIDAGSAPDWNKRAFAKGPHLVVVPINIEENVLPFVAAGHANIDAIR